jgi:N-acetylglucosamine-6-sulfatase
MLKRFFGMSPRRSRRAVLVIATALVASSAWTVSAAAAGRPNILVIVTDDQRVETLAAMPHVRKELRAEGTSFRNAFVPNSLCCPSRASILTGLHSHTTGVFDNVAPHGGFTAFEDRLTIATVLDDEGYRTAFVGRYLNGYVGATFDNWSYVPPGWDRWFAVPTGSYHGYSVSSDGALVGPFGNGPRDYSARVMTRTAKRFIDDGRRRFFLLFSATAPHSGPERIDGVKVATPAERDVGRFDDLPPWRPPTFGAADGVSDMPAYLRLRKWSHQADRRIDVIRQRQLETLYSLDRHLGSLLRAVPRNTLVIFTSDNGFMWGEHRWRSKQVPYEESIRVPLIVRWPGHVRRDVDPRLALNIDIVPTILGAVGLDPDTPTGITSRGGRVPPEGLDLFSGERRRAFVLEHLEGSGGAVPSYCGVRTKRWMYARYSAAGSEDDGFEDLYDIRDDPLQRRNLASLGAADRARERLRSMARGLCAPPPPGYDWRD